MLLYLSIFLIPFTYFMLSRRDIGLAQSKVACGLIFLFLGFFIGMGDMQGGYDRYLYGAYFDDMADAIRHNWIWSTYGHELGYSFFNWFIAHFSMNRYIFILLATLTMYALYYRAFITYLDDYPLALIVFMGLLYYFTMTYMRQTLAVGIAWQACRYAYERKPVPFFLWVFVAFSFHNSAIIFALMYFVKVEKFSKATIVKMMIILFLIGLTPIATWALNFFGEATDAEGRTSVYADNSGGYNYAYLFLSIFLAFIMVRNSDLIENNKKNIFFYNMGLMYCAVLLALIRFGQTGRLGWYYMFGLIYTLSTLARKSRADSYLRTLVIAMSFAMFLRITAQWDFNLSPYKTFLTNGYPCGIREIYDDCEYDDAYTKDKFTRPALDICTNAAFAFTIQKEQR